MRRMGLRTTCMTGRNVVSNHARDPSRSLLSTVTLIGLFALRHLLSVIEFSECYGHHFKDSIVQIANKIPNRSPFLLCRVSYIYVNE